MNYATTLAYDYRVFARSGSAVFQPLTQRALEAFEGLPLDPQGCFRASSDDEANALFDRLDEAALVDLTA